MENHQVNELHKLMDTWESHTQSERARYDLLCSLWTEAEARDHAPKCEGRPYS